MRRKDEMRRMMKEHSEILDIFSFFIGGSYTSNIQIKISPLYDIIQLKLK